MLVADALRLGGAILGNHPDMLAPQLIGRLLPEIDANVNVRMLLRACDQDGVKHSALLPLYHCLHTREVPSNEVKYLRSVQSSVVLPYFEKIIIFLSLRSSVLGTSDI